MNAPVEPSVQVYGSDLVGCRYRLVQKFRQAQGDLLDDDLANDDISPHVRHEALAIHDLTREDVRFRCEKLGTSYCDIAQVRDETGEDAGDGGDAGDGDGADGDLEAQYLATLDALAAGVSVIFSPVLLREMEHEAALEVAKVDFLVKLETIAATPKYLPVMISGSSVLKARRPIANTAGQNLGAVAEPVFQLAIDRALGKPLLGRTPRGGVDIRASILELPDKKLRATSRIMVHLGQMASALADYDVACDFVAILEEGRSHLVVSKARRAEESYLAASELDNLPDYPRQVRQCKSCRFEKICHEELLAIDDISLVLPGDRAASWRKRGIDTVALLAQQDSAKDSAWLARAWQHDLPAVRRTEHLMVPRADVEIDVDMEAYPVGGAYLWGTWVAGGAYQPFVTWDPPSASGLGGDAEAANFARFWDWLHTQRQETEEAGKTFRAYCWAAEGENHWMRRTASRFGGVLFDGYAVPSLVEVERFIRSEVWTDLFAVVRKQLLSPSGLSLKTVAPWAGFRWRDEGVDGAASLPLYELAAGMVRHNDAASTTDEPEPAAAREQLLRYNGDDCRSMLVIRDWLDNPQTLEQIPYGANVSANG